MKTETEALAVIEATILDCGSDRLVYETFSDALGNLMLDGVVPAGCPEYARVGRAPGAWMSAEDHLAWALATGGSIGHGDPVAYFGTGGRFVLVRESADPGRVAAAVRALVATS